VIRDLSEHEVDSLLVRERLIRVAFASPGAPYVITLGYVWSRGAFWGVTSEGRKSRIAAESPRVGLQVDSSLTTGPFGWFSVVGEGRFAWVDAPTDAQAAGATLQTRFGDAPPWWQQEQASRFASGFLRFWCIQPEVLHGRHDEPPRKA
jgi:nitroimidazol reductase NimA-like FMN-containing flavoprotein (pyridoxamine 5'-phosphate oxidase superfamily)